MTGTTGDDLETFNRWPAATADRHLRACCAAPGWSGRLTGDRPYRETADLHAAADAALAEATWEDILVALSAHPRIGDRGPAPAAAKGADGESREAGWSTNEQAVAATAGDDAKAELRAANLAYEARFDHVFLICATGRTTEEISAELHRRLANDPATEQQVVRAELAKIVHLRLDKMLAEATPSGPVTLSTHVLDTSRGLPASDLDVRVDRLVEGEWVAAGAGRTGSDGRIAALLDGPAPVGTYRLVFDTGSWFGNEGIYPEVVVTARLGGGHWHLPVLVGPYSYSTYRGS
jgi:hydroxyisourate hydrolase